jgi:hypothetical protein
MAAVAGSHGSTIAMNIMKSATNAKMVPNQPCLGIPPIVVSLGMSYFQIFAFSQTFQDFSGFFKKIRIFSVSFFAGLSRGVYVGSPKLKPPTSFS